MAVEAYKHGDGLSEAKATSDSVFLVKCNMNTSIYFFCVNDATCPFSTQVSLSANHAVLRPT